jgi:hypothetical protein
MVTHTQTYPLSSDILVIEQIPVAIQTVTQRIVGNIHIREWERVNDLLNNLDERFITRKNGQNNEDI